MISAKTKRLSPLIEKIFVEIPYPFPIPLVLSVIQVESAGNAGVVNPKSGASGLMQVMPNTLLEYNKHNNPISLAVLRSKTEIAQEKQIRVGLWVMGQYIRMAGKFLQKQLGTFKLEDLIKLADNFYAAGPAGTKKKIGNLPPTAENIEKNFPNWSPVNHSRKVWNFTLNENPVWDTQKINDWIYDKIEPIIPNPDVAKIKNNFIAGLLILAVAIYFVGGKNGKI